MTNFDLEKWKTGNYKVKTVGGQEVLDLTYHSNAKGDYKLSGVVPTLQGINTWKVSGKYHIENEPTILDLMLEEPEMWVNAYENNLINAAFHKIYRTKQDALDNASNIGYIGTFKLVKDGE